MRSDWSTSAVWGSFTGGPYINNPGNGEEYYDKGSLAIVNGSRPFLVNAPAALQRWSSHRADDGSRFEQPVYDDIFGDTAPRSLFNVFYVGPPAGAGQGFKLRAQGARTRMSAFEDRGAA